MQGTYRRVFTFFVLFKFWLFGVIIYPISERNQFFSRLVHRSPWIVHIIYSRAGSKILWGKFAIFFFFQLKVSVNFNNKVLKEKYIVYALNKYCEQFF